MKIISVFTLLCFLITNVAGNLFANAATIQPYKYKNSLNINEVVNKHNILAKYGQIAENVYKENTPLVILINDLHNNSYVQSNIEQIIDLIRQNSNIDKIIIEGAPNKQISTALFSSINKQERLDIVNSMLNKGKISGAESFIIKNDFYNMYGLEQWNIYMRNIKMNSLLKNRYIDNINELTNLFVQRRISFPKTELFSTFTYDNSLETRIVKIGNFCNANKIDLTLYPELNKFIAVNNYKNVKDINDEFNKLFNDIKQYVPYNIYLYIANLLKHSNGNTSSQLNLLFSVVKSYSPEIILKYNSLLTFLNNIELKASIKSYSLLQETDNLERFIIDQFADNNEKELIETDRFLYLLSEYVNLSLTYNQYEYLQNNKEYLYQIAFKYLGIKAMEIINNILQDSQLSQYYSVNVQRNAVFYDNLVKLLNIDNSKSIKKNNISSEDILNNLHKIKSVNIVVVGGFHNQLLDMLKQSNVSILSIMPQVKQSELKDNEIITDNKIVYHNALAPPSVLVQADMSTIALLIDSWIKSMNKMNATVEKQADIIHDWLNTNNINLRFHFDNNQMAMLNDVPISQLLDRNNEQPKSSTIKHKKIFDILWTLNNFKLKNYFYYLNIKTFFEICRTKIKQLFNNLNLFQDISIFSSGYLSRKLLNERIISNEYQRTLNSLDGEMPDVVVITVDDRQDIDFCEQILADIKSYPNFSNTRIQYIVKNNSGTGAGFTQAVRYLTKTDFNKPFKDVKAVIIDIDGTRKDIIGSKRLPMQFNGRNITPLELALLNGIRSCHKFRNIGGIAVIDPRSVYIGNMVPTGDITFVSSAVNMQEIQNHKMSLIIKDYPDKLEQIYYGFNPDKIADIVEKKGIEHKNFYNFDNQSMRQFEVVTGNILIHFGNQDNYLQFADFMSQVDSYLKRGTDRINIIQHIFIPFIRVNHQEKVQSYFAKVRNKEETSKERKFFMGLADIFTDYYDNNNLIKQTKFGVYHQSKSLYSRNFSDKLFEKLSNIFKAKQLALSDSSAKSKIKQKQVIITESFTEDSELARAYKLLSRIHVKQLKSLIDYEQVYETLTEIIRTTSFKKELYATNSVHTAKLYKYISDIISNTIAQINSEKQFDNSNIERTYLENLKISFLSMQHYTIEYIRLLDYTSNMMTLGSYVFPQNSFFEKFKLMPFNRFVFGFTRGINKAKQNIRQQLTTVYSSGNFLIDSLYSFPMLKNDLESFISEFENPKQKTSVGMQKQWGNRRAIQRFLSMTIALQSFTTTIITALISSSGLNVVTISAAAISLLTGLGLSIFLHRGSIWFGWKDKFYNKKKKEIEYELRGNGTVKKSIEFFAYDEQLFFKLSMLFIKLMQRKDVDNNIKQLLQKNLDLLQQYDKQYDLQLINIILNNSRQINSSLSDNNSLKMQLQQFIEYLDKLNIDDEPAQGNTIGYGFVPDMEITRQEVNKYLMNWLSIIETNVISKSNIDNIINNATQIIKLTSFDKDTLKGTNKDILISELQDFISFYNKTVELFLQLTPERQNELRPELEILERAGQYALLYYKALNYLVSLEILYGYKISKGNKFYFLEMFGIMGIVRRIYGIQTGIFLSKRKFIKTIQGVKSLGNELVSGLYNDDVEKNINLFFQEKEKPQYFYLGITESWKVRKMLARFLPLVFFVRTIILNILSGSFSAEQLLLSFFTGVGLSITLHWIPILSGFFKTMVIKKMKIPAKKKEINTLDINRQLLLQKQIYGLSKVPYGQMPDLIILAGDGSKYSVETLNSSVSNIKQYGKLPAVPVKSLLIDENGGSGNVLIEVFNFLQSQQLYLDYPELSHKNIKDLKIVVVNIDGLDSSLITTSLDIEILNKQTTPIELALLNSIGMIQNNTKESGNIVVADPSYMYLGNLMQTDNITLLGSNITYEQLKQQKLPLFISNQLESSVDGSSKLKKIYSSFDSNKIANILVKHMFRQMYDMDNLSIVQMPAFAGLIGISFDDERNFQQLLQFMNIAKQYEQNYNGKKFQIDLISHLFIPLTRLINKEDIFVYLESLKYSVSSADKTTKDEYDQFFWGLFDKFDKSFRGQLNDSFINVITSQDSIMTKNQLKNKFYRQFVTLLSQLKQFNIKQQFQQIKKDISNFILPRQQTGILIVPELSEFAKQQIYAFDNDVSNNIAITSFNQLSDEKQDSGIIINVPIENTIIPAQIFYDVIRDQNGKAHIVVAFMPLLMDNIDMYSSVKETDLLNSILSKEITDVNEIRKQLFIGRAALSFIQELKTNPGLEFVYQDITFIMKQINPSFIVSFDDSGIFAIPQLIKDRFVQDKFMESIKYININVSDKQPLKMPLEYMRQIQTSNLINRYNIIHNDGINLSLLAELVSNYNFSFINSDITSFFSSQKQYAENILNNLFNASVITDNFSNINFVPVIVPKKFSDIIKLYDLLQNVSMDKFVLKDIFIPDTSLFNIKLIDIYDEIDRLNDTRLAGLKQLPVNLTDTQMTFDNNTIFILQNLLQYVKSNEYENSCYQQFLNGQTSEFKNGIEYLTAKYINKTEQIISKNGIEQLKQENIDKWNYYYELNEYIQYIAYTQFNNMTTFVQDRQIQTIVDINISDIISNDAAESKVKSLSLDLSAIDKNNITAFLTDISKRYKSAVIFCDISDLFDNSDLFEKINILDALLNVTKTSDYIEYGKSLSIKYKEDISSDTVNNVVQLINISDLDSVSDEYYFKYVYNLLNNAGIDKTRYKHLFELIDKLNMQYMYAKADIHHIFLEELKGLLLGIYESQQVIEMTRLHNNINIKQINSLLCCA